MERSGVGVKTESMTEEKREKYIFLSPHTSCCKTELKKKNDFFADCTPVGK